jgi:DNA-binding beta-propeller fold protein YncE
MSANIWRLCGLLLFIPLADGTAQTQLDCNAAAADPTVVVPLPGHPFQALPTADGCWVLVSINAGPDRGKSGVAVLRRAGGKLSLDRVIELDGGPTGMALTNHDSLLVVAAGDGIGFVDVTRAIQGRRGAVLGLMKDGGRGVGRVYAAATSDGRLAFTSDERTQTISVIDLAAAAKNGFAGSAIIGKIRVGQAPVALTLSNDQKLLYTTSQSAPRGWNWPIVCRPEGRDASVAPNHSEGAIIVIDVAKASATPAQSVVAVVGAGCNPVRLVLSPAGDRAYVSERGADRLNVFDTHRILSDSGGARVASVLVGAAPVGIAVIDSGRKVIVTSSNRFAGPTDPQFLTVIAADKVDSGAVAVLGSIAAGAFPRELRVTADGRALFLTNFGSRTVEMFDIARLPIRPVGASH